jgi:hypothetical protein
MNPSESRGRSAPNTNVTEEQRQWEQTVVDALSPERDKLQARVDEIRKLRMDIGLQSRASLVSYRMKLGELAFLVGAAVTPVVIASDGKVKHIEYALVGAALYLATGLLLFWHSRSLLYQDASDAPLIGLDIELDLEPLIHSYNKLLLEPSNASYKEEYIATTKRLTENALAAQGQQNKAPFDISIDLGLYGFMAATLFVARTVWPSDGAYFWIVFWTFIVIAIGVLGVNYVLGLRARSRLRNKRNKVISSREEYQEWHNKEVLDK